MYSDILVPAWASDTSRTSDVRIHQYIDQFKQSFTEKKFAKMHILLVEISPNPDQPIKILLNEFGEHPVQKRKEMNPTVAKRGANGKPPPKMSQPTFIFDEFQPM
jgi:hypothetical protein